MAPSLILSQLTPQIASAVGIVAAVPPPVLTKETSAETLLAEGIRLLHDDGMKHVESEAMSRLRLANTVKPNDARILAELGFASMRLRGGPRPASGELRVPSAPEHFADARKYLERSLAIDSDLAEVYVYLGYVEFMMFNDAKVVEHLKRARSLGSTHVWISLLEADLAQVKGQGYAALSKYLRILRAPESGRLARLLALHNAAQLAAINGRKEEYLHAARRFISEESTPEQVRVALAEILIETFDEPAQAFAMLERKASKECQPCVQRLRSIALALMASRVSDPEDGSSGEARLLLNRAVEAAGSFEQLVRNLLYDSRGVEIVEQIALERPRSEQLDALLLELAIGSGQYDMLDRLLKSGADANAQSSHGTGPLIAQAALMNDAEAFRLLLEHGANPSSQLYDGRTLRIFLQDVRDDVALEMISALDRQEDLERVDRVRDGIEPH